MRACFEQKRTEKTEQQASWSEIAHRESATSYYRIPAITLAGRPCPRAQRSRVAQSGMQSAERGICSDKPAGYFNAVRRYGLRGWSVNYWNASFRSATLCILSRRDNVVSWSAFSTCMSPFQDVAHSDPNALGASLTLILDQTSADESGWVNRKTVISGRAINRTRVLCPTPRLMYS